MSIKFDSKSNSNISFKEKAHKFIDTSKYVSLCKHLLESPKSRLAFFEALKSEIAREAKRVPDDENFTQESLEAFGWDAFLSNAREFAPLLTDTAGALIPDEEDFALHGITKGRKGARR